MVSRRLLVCFDIQIWAHVKVMNQGRITSRCRNAYRLARGKALPAYGWLEVRPRSTSDEFRGGHCNMADYCSTAVCYLPTVKRRD